MAKRRRAAKAEWPSGFDRIHLRARKDGGPRLHPRAGITVGLIVSLVAEGIAWEEILKDYPDLERDDIRQALGYAAWLTRQEIVSV